MAHTTARVQTHDVSWRGRGGAMFWMILVAAIVYALGFATYGWYVDGSRHEGLWESCSCGSMSGEPDWMKATQAMMSIGLIGVAICLLLIILYMVCHAGNLSNVLIFLIIFCFLSAAVMGIGLAVYATNKKRNFSYSFAFECIGGILTLLAGIIGIFQSCATKRTR